MSTRWLDEDELVAWTRFIAVVELLPGVLEQQLRRDSGLTHMEYMVLAMLSEAPDRTLRMSALAARANASLPRLSHLTDRMEARGLVRRAPCAEDRRATNATLTGAGWEVLRAAAPGHVETVRRHVLDPLTSTQVRQLSQISKTMLAAIDPSGTTAAPHQRRTAGEAPA